MHWHSSNIHYLHKLQYIFCLQILNKKKKLQQFFKEAIEEKKRFELELKNDEEFEDRALEIYRKAKDRIQEIHKSTVLREKEEKIRQAQNGLAMFLK